MRTKDRPRYYSVTKYKYYYILEKYDYWVVVFFIKKGTDEEEYEPFQKQFIRWFDK